MMWERDGGETMRDYLNIGIVVKGLDLSFFTEHFLFSASCANSWTVFRTEKSWRLSSRFATGAARNWWNWMQLTRILQEHFKGSARTGASRSTRHQDTDRHSSMGSCAEIHELWHAVMRARIAGQGQRVVERPAKLTGRATRISTAKVKVRRANSRAIPAGGSVRWTT